MKKTAVIYGITGQDGSYLSEFLIKKNYVVHGVKRRSSSINTERINHLYQDPHEKNKNFILHYGDVTDTISVKNTIEKIKPDEIYNLAAQSHVSVSFEIPEYTADVDALGTLRLLDVINNLKERPRFYQASTSEIFGGIKGTEPQNEKTPFYPKSPYGIAKLYAYWLTVNYREAYDLFACNGILFNHESPRRGETFVTKKITKGVAKIKKNELDCIYLGNLNAQRDWGYAKEYVDLMWLMLQHDKPEDFVAATGKSHSIREFAELAFEAAGMKIVWEGKGLEEVGVLKESGKIVVSVDEKYFRPAEVEFFLGDSSKAEKILGWKAETTIKELVKKMVDYDLNNDSFGGKE